jgi:hypothetical protein
MQPTALQFVISNIYYNYKYTRFQKLIKMYFSSYTGTTYTVSSGNCPKCLMYYRQFTSHAYCRDAGPVSKMGQQQKATWVIHFKVSRSVITVQHEFHAWFKKDARHKNNGAHSLLLMRHYLGNWSCGPALSMRSERSTWETWTVPAADRVCCACVGWEIKYLITFETAPFFCVCPVYFINKKLLSGEKLY